MQKASASVGDDDRARCTFCIDPDARRAARGGGTSMQKAFVNEADCDRSRDAFCIE